MTAVERHRTYYLANREKILAKTKLVYLKRKDSSLFRWGWFVTHLKRRYNLTESDYLQMLWKSKGRCYNSSCQQLGRVCVDHSHTTGVVRGLLCDRCNRTLGQVKDKTEILGGLSSYLKKAA